VGTCRGRGRCAVAVGWPITQCTHAPPGGLLHRARSRSSAGHHAPGPAPDLPYLRPRGALCTAHGRAGAAIRCTSAPARCQRCIWALVHLATAAQQPSSASGHLHAARAGAGVGAGATRCDWLGPLPAASRPRPATPRHGARSPLGSPGPGTPPARGPRMPMPAPCTGGGAWRTMPRAAPPLTTPTPPRAPRGSHAPLHAPGPAVAPPPYPPQQSTRPSCPPSPPSRAAARSRPRAATCGAPRATKHSLPLLLLVGAAEPRAPPTPHTRSR
jgi:hypothetical protein